MSTYNKLKSKRLGIDTYKECVIYMREDCHVCRSEGFEVHARILVTYKEKSIIATLNLVKSDLLDQGSAGLSEHAWNELGAVEGELIEVAYAPPLTSFSYVRSKIYSHELESSQIMNIIQDIEKGWYADIHIASFLTASAGGRLTLNEVKNLTKAMVESGQQLTWSSDMIVDKHCVGGLPGNRTSPIIVSIVAAYGLKMPKTSSRAITSPAGTADTMEVLTPVAMSLEKMKQVVEEEGGCLTWGGALSLSPVDDTLITVERVLDLDSEGQLVASILSKKLAAGSTHVVIDMPIGPTAKVRSQTMAEELKRILVQVGWEFGLIVKVVFTDGTQPIGNGIGPALEARDVVDVLKCESHAPQTLRNRSLLLAGQVLEFSPHVKEGEGVHIATDILDSGKAWEKFQAICHAQGGMKDIPVAQYIRPFNADTAGVVTEIDNRRLAKLAKLAGAPVDVVAGVELKVHLGDRVKIDDVLFTVHAYSSGELEYAMQYLQLNQDIIQIKGIA